LVHYREIRRIPGTKYPVLYTSTLPVPKGTESHITVNCREGANSKQGGGSEKREPTQCRIHLNGQIYSQVTKVGTRQALKTERGIEVGDWKSKPGHPLGSVEYKGWIRIEDQHIEFFYREGNRGSKTFTVNPGHSYQTAPNAKEKGMAALIDRARYIMELLRPHGWKFTEPEIRGIGGEAGIPNHPLIERINRDNVKENATIKLDTSKGGSEIELTDAEATDIACESPEHIVQLYTNDSLIVERQDASEEELLQMKKKSRLIVDILKDNIYSAELIAKKQTIELEGQVHTLVEMSDGISAAGARDVMYG